MGRVLRDIVGGILLVIFFISTLALSAYDERIFVSPDENAAFYFAKTFAETGALMGSEPLNVAVNGLVHPRSMIAVGATLVPGSFLGLPILTGALNWAFGDAATLLFTPLLAFFSILAWRKIMREMFEDELLADLSTFFFMIHPAFWYYSGRVMMHNVSFLSFLIFAAYLIICAPLKEVKTRFAPELRRFEMFLAGIFVGTALFIRTAEIVWVVVGFLALLFVYRAQLGWRNLVAAVLGLTVMAGVIGYANNEVYGSPFLTGYTVRADISGEAAVVAPVIPTVPEQMYNFLFPFGIHPRAIMRHEFYYESLLYPWMAIPAVLGFLFLAFKKFEKAKTWRVLAIGTLILAFWLGAVYGSWSFNDNPDPRLISIGNSYVRYWLPLFALAAPFAAYIVFKAYGKLPAKIAPVFLAIIVIAVTGLSGSLVLYGHDGIMPTRDALHSFLEKRRDIYPLTQRDAIIIVDRADKYLFPFRRVVTPLRSDATYAALPEFVKHAPVYYFGITLPEKDLAYLNEVKLKDMGLQIEYLKTMADESLYRIYEID